jgi:hypothetical protein
MYIKRKNIGNFPKFIWIFNDTNYKFYKLKSLSSDNEIILMVFCSILFLKCFINFFRPYGSIKILIFNKFYLIIKISFWLFKYFIKRQNLISNKWPFF